MKIQHTTQKHLLSILMENEVGSLTRVVALFAQRGYNIDTLNVAPTHDKSISRLNVTTYATAAKIEQLTKQLHKLIEVVKVQDLSDFEHDGFVCKEGMLVKIRATAAYRDEVLRLVDIFGAKVVDVGQNLYTVLVVGHSKKLCAFTEAIGLEHILETTRTGAIGLARGEKMLQA